MEPRMIELQKSSRLDVEMLEERAAPSHLGHDVELPPAAAHGARGIAVATAAPAAHTRATLILILE